MLKSVLVSGNKCLDWNDNMNIQFVIPISTWSELYAVLVSLIWSKNYVIVLVLDSINQWTKCIPLYIILTWKIYLITNSVHKQIGTDKYKNLFRKIYFFNQHFKLQIFPTNIRHKNRNTAVSRHHKIRLLNTKIFLYVEFINVLFNDDILQHHQQIKWSLEIINYEK